MITLSKAIRFFAIIILISLSGNFYGQEADLILYKSYEDYQKDIRAKEYDEIVGKNPYHSSLKEKTYHFQFKHNGKLNHFDINAPNSV